MWFLVPIHNTLARDYGIYALLLMIVLLFITFYGSIFSYRSLKNAHRFMGAAFFLAALHIYVIPSSASSDIVLKVSCLGMAIIGCIAFVYRTLLGNVLVPRFKYNVSSVSDLGQGVTEITLAPVKKMLKHFPGQFAMLSFVNSKVVGDEEHPFTISSASHDTGEVRFSIKSLGDYTGLLPQLAVGTKARLEGPFGEFTYTNGSRAQIWVAGGIGVTPFTSMAEDLLSKETIDYTIDFFYSARSEKDGVYKELFTSLAKKHPSFVFHFMPSDTAGYVTAEGIIKTVDNATKRDIFVCGPPPMMSALIGALVTSGIARGRIHSERFALLK
jgi:predicted ferric reductase